MQCLARIPLLGDFVAENKEKLSPIKKPLSACLNLATEFPNLFKYLPPKKLQWV